MTEQDIASLIEAYNDYRWTEPKVLSIEVPDPDCDLPPDLRRGTNQQLRLNLSFIKKKKAEQELKDSHLPQADSSENP